LADTLPLRVLVADDNEINRKVLVRLLGQLGYRPDLACNGLEVQAAVQRQSYDLIFMDVRMPGCDGLEATRHLRALETQTGRRRCAVVAITANAMPGDREACLAAGMDEYVAKPFPPDIVKTCLLRFCQPSEKVAAAAPPAPPATTPAPLAAGAPSEPVLDVNRLMESAAGSADEARELLKMLVKQTEALLPQIAAALERKDATQASHLAHRSAGASSLCGALALSRLFRQLEHAANAGDFEQAGGHCRRLPEAWARFRACATERKLL
jgi:CheY-like chemotaxis protein